MTTSTPPGFDRSRCTVAKALTFANSFPRRQCNQFQAEEALFDERSGRIMNPSLAEYHLPVHMDVPAIEVIWTDIPDPHSPLGAHGIGEIGITGVGAAVANAVYNATGKRIRELPITLDKLM
jgi:xanthine dehydrogenase YagR molybdenum-binding subunit